MNPVWTADDELWLLTNAIEPQRLTIHATSRAIVTHGSDLRALRNDCDATLAGVLYVERDGSLIFDCTTDGHQYRLAQGERPGDDRQRLSRGSTSEEGGLQ